MAVRRVFSAVVCGAFLVSVIGCGGEPSDPQDAGADGSMDASEPDRDGAVRDALVPDALVPDAFVPDAFVPDSSLPDGGAPECVDDATCGLGRICQAGGCTAGCRADEGCPPGGSCCDGRCVDLASDPAACGACGTSCQDGARVAGARCEDMRCVLTCEVGYADCNGEPADGCETLLGTVEACRSCGEVCATPDGAARATCDEVTGCGIECPPGRAECDGLAATVCETDVQGDESHCGGCARLCAPQPEMSATCVAGTCERACTEGYDDCDGMLENGCEARLAQSTEHCGRCGNACAAGSTCRDGTFVALSCLTPSARDCDGDASNGCETDIASSLAHCGGCDRACVAGPGQEALCIEGTCTRRCTGAFRDCDGDAANGCEIDTATSATHCGACRNACSAPNGTPVCTGGACGIGACNAGWLDCTTAAGCETSSTDLAHCGACGRTCTVPNATAACDGTRCTIGMCNRGWGDCDRDPANGCEQRLETATHCGACNAPCAGPNAVSECRAGGACAILSCSAGWGDCDYNQRNGCEQRLNVPEHCTACFTRPREVCNGVDDDCDGSTDEGCPTSVRFGPTSGESVWTATTTAGSLVQTDCNAGMGAHWQRTWYETSPSSPYLNGFQLLCRPPRLEAVSSTRYRVRTPGDLAWSTPVTFSGPGVANTLCPEQYWLEGFVMRTRWVAGAPYVVSVQSVLCRELFLDVEPTGVRVTPGDLYPHSIFGVPFGWSDVYDSQTTVSCPPGTVIGGADIRAGWHMHSARYECRPLEWTTR
jgi:hypothetical protein